VKKVSGILPDNSPVFFAVCREYHFAQQQQTCLSIRKGTALHLPSPLKTVYFLLGGMMRASMIGLYLRSRIDGNCGIF
jgi:hypothetical protein